MRLCQWGFITFAVTYLSVSNGSTGAITGAEKTGLLNTPPAQVLQYTVINLQMGAVNPGQNPYVDGPDVTAVFHGPRDIAYSIKGYWDGGGTFSVRFAPTLAGEWTYTTVSDDAGLNGVRGSFTAMAPTAADLQSNVLRHGFLKPAGYGWKLGTDTPFLPIGETQWAFTEDFHTQEWKDWILVLKERSVNSFLGCIYLALYNRAGILPFDGHPSDDHLHEAFFDRLDEWVQFANDNGILMGLTIGGFPSNSAWYSLLNTDDRNARWFRYCVRRYAAYNVRWVLYGEVDEMNPLWASWDDNAKATAQLVREEDPYDHPIGSHHRTIDRATVRENTIDFLCIQSNRRPEKSDEQYLTTRDYRQYGKPLWFEEYWYENLEGLNPGVRNTYRNFISGMAFPTMGSLMRAHGIEGNFPPAMAEKLGLSLGEYLRTHDAGLRAMSYFAGFFKDIDTWHFAPAPEKIENQGAGRLCGRFGHAYAVYLQGGGSVVLDLTDAVGTFTVQRMNIHTGGQQSLPAVEGGAPRVIDTRDTSDAVLLVSGGRLPERPVINAPLENEELLPGETVFIKGQGDALRWRITLSGHEASTIESDIPDVTFRIPADARAGQVLRIRLTGAQASVEQAHNITMRRENRPPFVTHTTINVRAGESCAVNLFFSDPDGPGPYTYRILKDPAHGTLSGTGNDRLYTPKPHFTGPDQFTWQVDDGITSSYPQRVNIVVLPPEQ